MNIHKKRKKWLILFILIQLFWVGFSMAEMPKGLFQKSIWSEKDLKIVNDIIYVKKKNHHGKMTDVKMNVYIPKNALEKTAPCIVIIHGGGFVNKDHNHKNFVRYAKDYAKMGFVSASITYRKSESKEHVKKNQEVIVRNAFADGCDAIRHLKENAKTYGLDPDRILAIGSSAGGGVAVAMALEPELPDPQRMYPNTSAKVKAAITTGIALGKEWKQLVKFESDDSPLLMFHTPKRDNATGKTWEYAVKGCEMVKKAGVVCDIIKTPDVGHVISLGLNSPYFHAHIHPFILKHLL